MASMSGLFPPDQQFISNITEIILTNLRNKNFGVRELAHLSGMSPSALNHRLHSLINKNINEFIREVRLEKALEMIKNEAITASEVAYYVGFSSPAYFNKCFHEFFGYPPGHVKTQDIVNPEENYNLPVTSEKEKDKTARRILILKIYGILLLSFIILIATILVYSKIFRRNMLDNLRSADGRISVAIMPFQNLTNDMSLNVWQAGIQDNLISYLSHNPEELRLIQAVSIASFFQNKGITEYALLPAKTAIAILRKIDANVLVYGSISRTDVTLRINTQLINSKTGEILKSFQMDGSPEEILLLIDSLSNEVKNFLVITKLIKDNTQYPQKISITTHSPEAYTYHKEGERALAGTDYTTAINKFMRATAIDSNYIYPVLRISWTYWIQGLYDEGKKWCLKSYKKKYMMSGIQEIYADIMYAYFFETPYDAIKHINQLRQIDDQTPESYYLMGNRYYELQQYDKAIPEFEKSLEIYNKRGEKPFYTANYSDLGMAYLKTGQIGEAKKLLKKAEKDFPDNFSIISRQIILILAEGDTIKANELIRKFIFLQKERITSEADIATNLAGIYSETDILDHASKYYKQALSLEPENPVRIYNLAYFLIDKDRDINGGIQLVDEALKLDPENYLFLDCKGWGFYKQRKNKVALDLLERSWDLKPIYIHRIYLHLEEVRESVASKR